MNGHVYPELEIQTAINEQYLQPNVVYRNLGRGRFEDVSDLVGSAALERKASRGAAFGDFDNDGDIDALIMNMGDTPSLYRNDLKSDNHWVRLRLQGTKSNRSSIGAIVTIHTADGTQTKPVLSQSSFISQSDLRLHFGIRQTANVEKIAVTWPSGEREEFLGVSAGRQYLLLEGSGVPEAESPAPQKP